MRNNLRNVYFSALQIGKTGCGGDDTKCVDNGKCNTDTCECDPAKNAEADTNGLACSKSEFVL